MVNGNAYFALFTDYCSNRIVVVMQSYERGLITDRELPDIVWKSVFQGKLSYLHWNKGEEMAPTIAEKGVTLLVRKLPRPDPT